MSSVEETANLDSVVARLHSEFRSVDRGVVEEVVLEAFHAVARDASVTSFIPVLAQRDARRRLARLAAAAS